MIRLHSSHSSRLKWIKFVDRCSSIGFRLIVQVSIDVIGDVLPRISFIELNETYRTDLTEVRFEMLLQFNLGWKRSWTYHAWKSRRCFHGGWLAYAVNKTNLALVYSIGLNYFVKKILEAHFSTILYNISIGTFQRSNRCKMKQINFKTVQGWFDNMYNKISWL